MVFYLYCRMQENGLFETMLVEKGEILLKDLHFDRLKRGLKLLGIPSSKISIGRIEEEIKQASAQIKPGELSRVRLTVDKDASYHIKGSSLDRGLRNSKTGLVIDIYPHGRKLIDEFSNLKSTNYSLYINAARWAKDNGLDDCLLLNQEGNICESSISNVFIVKNNQVLTPSLSEGCIEGVMRKWLISYLKSIGYQVKETPILPFALETADEIFLTNAIRGIRWVKLFRDHQYSNSFSSTIYK